MIRPRRHATTALGVVAATVWAPLVVEAYAWAFGDLPDVAAWAYGTFMAAAAVAWWLDRCERKARSQNDASEWVDYRDWKEERDR